MLSDKGKATQVASLPVLHGNCLQAPQLGAAGGGGPVVMELGPAALHRPVPAQLNHDVGHCILNAQLSPCQYPSIHPCIRTVYLKKGPAILF